MLGLRRDTKQSYLWEQKIPPAGLRDFVLVFCNKVYLVTLLTGLLFFSRAFSKVGFPCGRRFKHENVSCSDSLGSTIYNSTNVNLKVTIS